MQHDRYSRPFHASWLTVMFALFATLFLIWSGIAFGHTRQLSPGPVLLTSLPVVQP